MSDLIEFSGLWGRTSRAGNVFYQAILSEAQVQNLLAAINDGCNKLIMFPKINHRPGMAEFDLYLTYAGESSKGANDDG